MRDDGTGSGIDNLSYAYPASGGKTINNRLNHIADQLAPNDNGKGVVDQDPGNYIYDATGNLTADVTEGITSITWTPYNTIRELVKTNATPATGTTTLRYLYDSSGNRVVKDYHATQNTTLTSRTWTIRNAQGTVLAIYTRKPSVGTSKREWQPTKAITSDECIENGLRIKLTEVIKLRRLVMSQGVNSGSKKDSISMTE